MDNWVWVYLGLAGQEVMVEIENGDILFTNKELPRSLAARNFTHVKVRKETRDEMQARIKAHKVEMPAQETIIETFPWVIEREKAVNDGVIFTNAIIWARRPHEDLITAAKQLWSPSAIIAVRS